MSEFFQPFRPSPAPRPADPVRSPTNMNVPEGWLAIGTITSPQGLKGEVRVYPDSDFPQRFLEPGQRWLLGSRDSEPQAIELLAGRYLEGKGLYIVRFAGVRDRNQAEALRGALLLVPESDRPPLEPGEFHLLDLIGLSVFMQSSQELVGSVVSIVPAGNDLLEVEMPDRQRVLVPLVSEIVPIVDLDNQRIEINPPPGLLS